MDVKINNNVKMKEKNLTYRDRQDGKTPPQIKNLNDLFLSCCSLILYLLGFMPILQTFSHSSLFVEMLTFFFLPQKN